ncbi:hypothetical protein ACTXT7_011181 [Hymenolepis weldensis]
MQQFPPLFVDPVLFSWFGAFTPYAWNLILHSPLISQKDLHYVLSTALTFDSLAKRNKSDHKHNWATYRCCTNCHIIEFLKRTEEPRRLSQNRLPATALPLYELEWHWVLVMCQGNELSSASPADPLFTMMEMKDESLRLRNIYLTSSLIIKM